jgi:hypothetical protein
MVELDRSAVGSVLEAAPDAILLVSANGDIALANAQAERMFGYARDELVGRPIDMLVPDAARPLHAEHRHHYMLAPEPRPMGAGRELTARRRDGTELPVEISLSTLDVGGERLVAAAVRDVTERRAATATQIRLAWTMQSSHDAIIAAQLDGTITSWNPGAERLYGYSASEVLGKHVSLLAVPGRSRPEDGVLARTVRGESVGEYQTTVVRKDGAHIRVSVTASSIVDANGVVLGIASIARDVTSLQRAEAKFRGLLEAAPDAILGVDPAGRIVLVNAQAERLFGYARDELIGEFVEVLVPETRRGRHVMERNNYFADPHARSMGAGMQLAGRRKDGTEFPAEISLGPLETEDGLVVSAAVRDITDRLAARAERERLRAVADRERQQRQEHQAQRLESLGQLAGGVAHDFNNLLSAILNYTAFAAEQVETEGQRAGTDRFEPIVRDLEQVTRAAQRAAELTHQLLAFARRDVVRPRLLDINEVVHEVEQLLRRTLGEHVELSILAAEHLWPVTADPGQIEQVLLNLAINARDAMGQGGTLVIETGNVLVDEQWATMASANLTPGPHVQLRVSDTGSGMSDEVLVRAFEPFFTTKPKGEGTGLGLATVYGIITQAGGDIHIYSEEGRGTTFTALLPATPGSVPERDEEDTPNRLSGDETVLVVEDEDAIREITRRMLERNGYRVLSAANGPEAITMIESTAEAPDLLITDVVMPQMAGTDLAARLTASSPGIRVVYMSGYAQPLLSGTVEPGRLLVEKPFSERILLERVRAALDAPA